MESKNLSIEVIEKMLHSEDADVKRSAMIACLGRNDIPFDLIRIGLSDSEADMRYLTLMACKGRFNIPSDIISVGMMDENRVVREKAKKLKNRLSK